MGLIVGSGCVCGSVILYAILYFVEKSKDGAQQCKNVNGDYTMRIKRKEQVAFFSLTVILFSIAAFAYFYLLDDDHIEAIIIVFIFSLSGFIMAMYSISLTMWKVVVLGDRLETSGLMKKKNSYLFSDIYIITVKKNW